MAITAADVKKLRDATLAGMMDCKAALNETNGDFDAAVEWLRKKGMAGAGKKAGRIASEGAIGAAVSADGQSAALYEINCETDFVARGEKFMEFVGSLGGFLASRAGDEGHESAEALANETVPALGTTITQACAEVTAATGEKTTLRRFKVFGLGGQAGSLASYIHPGARVGVLVRLSFDKAETAAREDVRQLGLDICLQAAAMKPLAIDPSGLPEEVVAKEKAFHQEQAAGSGKPAAVIEKMIEGKLRKWYEEVCLIHQIFVKDLEKKPTIQAVVDGVAKAAGDKIRVSGMARFELGEGLEKRGDDFAGEVAKMMGA